jgi:tetratricopeptide (TPR) repeat protein
VDLETAAALGAKTEHAKAKTSRLGGPRNAGEAVAEFARRVESDAATDALVEAALALHRGFNAVRLRYDEVYQDRIWAISDTIRGEPKNADRHEMLGHFLFDHHIVPTVWNGPRDVEQLRPQSKGERAQEVQRALESADAALKLDGRHVNAMATKGWVFYRYGRSGPAEALADQGLGIEPRNVRVLALKSRVLQDRAAQFEAQASALRAGRTETSREQRSDGVYEVRRYYPPTAEQLAEASRCDEKAAACRKEAGRLDSETARVKSRVVPALVSDGNKALGSMLRNLRSARHAFEEAYGCDPDNRDVLKGLAEVLKRQGDTRASRAFALLAEPMQHTTAVEALKPAWDACVRTAWKTASEALDRAAQLDPADARVPAYRSVVAEGRGDAQASGRQRRAAIALEEARARLMGSSFVTANNVPLRLHEPGLMVVVRLQHGNASSAARQHDEALQTYAANLGIEKRFTKDDWVQLVPTAMLPDPQQNPTVIPDAPSLASLMAWSRLGAARTLIAVGRPAEAQQEFRTIRTYLANWPATAKDRETMNVVDSWARLGIAEAAVAAKDYDTAFKLLMSGEGWPWGLPQSLETRRKALAEHVRQARQQASSDEMNTRMRLSPAEQRARQLQDDIAQLQKQRDGMAAELNSPNLPAADRRALQMSIADLDRQIAMRKGGASRYRQMPEEPEQPPQGTRGTRPGRSRDAPVPPPVP